MSRVSAGPPSFGALTIEVMWSKAVHSARSTKQISKARRGSVSTRQSRRAPDSFWRKVVESWTTPLEAWHWFRARGIEDVEAADARWLRSSTSDSKLVFEGKGAGRALYRAILSDERFGGDFSGFQMWLQPWRDFPSVVSAWYTPDDAVIWARLYDLPARKLIDSCWLRKSPLLADRDGFKGLYSAILEDSRFFGKFSKFSSWFKQGSSDNTTVAEWRTREDVLRWAAHNGLDASCLSDETVFRGTRRRIHRAIVSDPRFRGNFKKFKSWLDLAAVVSPTVSSWRDRADAELWAEGSGISLADLGSPDTLTSKGLSPIVAGVLSDSRFKGDFGLFRRWLGLDIDWVALVRSWRSKEDALDWAVSTRISWEFLEGGVLSTEPYGEELRRAILEDERFEGKISRFRAWLGLETDFVAVVRKWSTPRDAIAWGSARGITASNLGRRSWLNETSALPASQGGIGECLEGLAHAIALDPRFEGDFSKFNRWLGVNNWRAIVQSWKTPRDARTWAAARGMSWDEFAASVRRSRRTHSTSELAGLKQAIMEDARFIGDLTAFFRWLRES